MTDIQLFTNPEFGGVRCVMQGEEPWFVAKDVAEVLGYVRPIKAVQDHVDEEDRKLLNFKDFYAKGQSNKFNDLQTSLWGNPNDFKGKWIINESGVYSLILGSKLPNAKRFQHWVTSEVLPSIRKHKAYITPDKVVEILADPDNMIKLLQTLKSEREAKEQAQAQIERDRPKVLFADAVSCSKTSILIGELAKLIKQNGVDIGQNRLFEWMRTNGYLTKNNRPTQYAMDLKLFEVVERTVNNPDGSVRITTTTKATGKGQQYFINKLLGNNETDNDATTI